MPLKICQWAYRSQEYVRIAMARLRTHWYQALGANIAAKCLFGARVKLERPWRITMGTRCMLQENVWLNVGGDSGSLIIGDHTFIGRNTEIEVARSVEIGKGCLIAPGVFITDHNHSTQLGMPMWQQSTEISSVVIEDDVWIGANAVILPGVTLEIGSVVAAGSVVNRDVAANSIVGGVPAKLLKMRDTKDRSPNENGNSGD